MQTVWVMRKKKKYINKISLAIILQTLYNLHYLPITCVCVCVCEGMAAYRQAAIHLGI